MRQAYIKKPSRQREKQDLFYSVVFIVLSHKTSINKWFRDKNSRLR